MEIVGSLIFWPLNVGLESPPWNTWKSAYTYEYEDINYNSVPAQYCLTTDSLYPPMLYRTQLSFKGTYYRQKLIFPTHKSLWQVPYPSGFFSTRLVISLSIHVRPLLPEELSDSKYISLRDVESQATVSMIHWGKARTWVIELSVRMRMENAS